MFCEGRCPWELEMTYYLYMVARRQQPGGLQLGRGMGSREVTWDHYSTLGQGSDGGCAVKCAYWFCQESQGGGKWDLKAVSLHFTHDCSLMLYNQLIQNMIWQMRADIESPIFRHMTKLPQQLFSPFSEGRRLPFHNALASAVMIQLWVPSSNCNYMNSSKLFFSGLLIKVVWA